MYKFFAVLLLSLLVSSSASASPFKRGDANDDNMVNIGDVNFINNYLWLAGPAPHCPDAADTNDDGVIDISDPIYLLNFLFNGGPNIPPPGSFVAGVDRTVDSLICWDHSPELQFKRGDVNQDHVVNSLDLNTLSHWISFGGDVGLCPDAADVNDDEVLNGADATYLSNYLFNHGNVPPQPFPECGIDPTNTGALWCANQAVCQ